jgi:large subunit ribosomal protein L24
MQRFHIKRNDVVVVLAGSQKGKSGKVLEILAAKQRARVEGLAMIKRPEKKSEKNPQGAITEREGSIHISNLMLQSVFDSSTRRPKSATAAATATAVAEAPAAEAPAKKPAKKATKKAKSE